MRLHSRCDRCKNEQQCQFYGYTADTDKGTSKNGEWLCDPCMEARIVEMDIVIARFREALGITKRESYRQ